MDPSLILPNRIVSHSDRGRKNLFSRIVHILPLFLLTKLPCPFSTVCWRNTNKLRPIQDVFLAPCLSSKCNKIVKEHYHERSNVRWQRAAFSLPLNNRALRFKLLWFLFSKEGFIDLELKVLSQCKKAIHGHLTPKRLVALRGGFFGLPRPGLTWLIRSQWSNDQHNRIKCLSLVIVQWD